MSINHFNDNFNQPTFIGIDVAKDSLALFVSSSEEHFSFANNQAGFAQIIALAKQFSPKRICLEATGGYQTPLLLALADAGLPVSLVNPRQVRHFAKGVGRLAKTDKIDAQVLALFAEQVEPRLTVIPNDEQMVLSALVRRREQILEMLNAEKNRLETAHHSIKPSLEKNIKWFESQLQEIDDDLDQNLKSSNLWEKAQLLETIPGLARVSSLALLSELPELGTLSNKEIAALVGVAPFSQSSGKWRGQAKVQQGREFVRRKLYMTAFNAIRCNARLKSFYEHLRLLGKPFKVALVAVMRKLLCYCNSMLRYQTPWQPLLT